MLSISTILFTIIIALFLYSFYKWSTFNYDYFEKRGIKYMKPYPLIGNSTGFIFRYQSIYDFILSIYNAYPNERISGFFDMGKPIYLLRDPEIVKQVTIKDFDHFVDHRVLIDEKVDPLLGNALISLRGQKWRDMRATLSPAFTGSKMREMFGLISECANDMSNYFLKESNNGKIKQVHEMKEIFSRFTNDVIATAAFGVKVDSFKDKDNEFFVHGQGATNLRGPLTILKFMAFSLFPWLIRKFKVTLIGKKYHKFFRSIVLETMDEREKKNIVRHDIINLLMESKKGNLKHEETTNSIENSFAAVEESTIGKTNVKRTWSDDEIVGQCFIFFFAGFDTSSTLMSFLAYEIATNVDVQEKLFSEIIDAHEQLDRQLMTYDVLQTMTYMDMVISEGLRKWPPAGVSDRVCVKDYNLVNGDINIKLKVGDNVWFPIYGFHTNPKYFPNPEKFDPERFNNENKKNIDSAVYLPFGSGPRNCIGSRFALMEIKAVLYYLLLNFEFKVTEKTQIPIQLIKTPVSVTAEKGVWLELYPRNK